MVLAEEKRQKIRSILEKFLSDRAKTIRNLKMDHLQINPFLIRILANEMDLRDSHSIVKWMVNQRIERGAVTSFGYALQEIAKVFSEGTGVEGADILKTKNGRHYHIQVKSGPNTIPKDLGVRISQLLRSAQRRNRGSVALFGMCYGNREQVSSIVKKYVEKEGGIGWLSGREFWEFISDSPDCITEIYALIAEVSESFRDPSGKSLNEIRDEKITQLESQFKEIYGQIGNKMWQVLLERNS